MKPSVPLSLLLAGSVLTFSPDALLAAPKNPAATFAGNNAAKATKAIVAQTLNVEVSGNDATATRGNGLPFATVTAAINKSQAGDTVHIGAGKFPLPGFINCAKSIYLVGSGVGVTTIKTNNNSAINFQAPVQIRGINFDSGTNATGTAGRNLLIQLDNTSGNTVADCRFHGINGICIQGAGITNSAFSNLQFDHTYQPVFIDSCNGNLPGGLSFTKCQSNHSIAGGFIVHSVEGYQGTDESNEVTGLSSGVDFMNCTVKDVPNALGFEVWHGWTNIRFTKCAAADCAFGFSVSNCDHATFTGCTSNNSSFLYEAAISHDVSFINCTADGRPTATSPQAGAGLPFGSAAVVCDGPSHDVQWVGGSILAAKFHTFTGHDFKLLGTNMQGSMVNIQNASNVTVQGCTFSPLDGSPSVPNWVFIDCGAEDISNIVFNGNTCLGALPYACMEVYGAPHAIDGLEISGNHTDGVYNNAGGFVHNQGVTLTNHYFAGNTTDNPNAAYPANTCFPNDAQ